MAELTTISAVKSQLDITVSTYDSMLTAMLDAAESYIRNLCNRPDGWTAGEWSEVIDGRGEPSITLTNTPIDETAALVLYVDGEEVVELRPIEDDLHTSILCLNSKTGVLSYRSAGARLTGSMGWSMGWNSGLSTVPPTDRGPWPTFPRGPGRIKVEYTGGYSSIPAALTQAANEVVKALWFARKRDTALQSEDLGQYSYTLGTVEEAIGSLRPTLAALLSEYIRHGAF